MHDVPTISPRSDPTGSFDPTRSTYPSRLESYKDRPSSSAKTLDDGLKRGNLPSGDERVQLTTPINTEAPVEHEYLGSTSSEKPNSLLVEPLINRLEYDERTPTTSDATSFQTALEGDQSVDEQRSIAETETATETGRNTIGRVSDGRVDSRSVQPSEARLPSIPLADLAPLRNLLQHATTARECQMILSAVLTQWGVPQTSSDIPQPSPESRVAAWLLAGRDGPDVTDTPTSSAFSRTANDGLVTPTQDIRLFSVTKEPSSKDAAEIHGHEEEEYLRSETTSEAWSSREDLHEGLQPSFAQSAGRMLPVKLQSGVKQMTTAIQENVQSVTLGA